MDCGVTCLRIIIKFYGREISIYKLRKLSNITKVGTSLLDLSEAAELLGFRSKAVNVSLSGLSMVQKPCIIHWKQKHFSVLYKIKNDIYYLSDPASGLYQLNKAQFTEYWFSHKNHERGITLQLTPTPAFALLENDIDNQNRLDWSILLRYFVVYKKLFFQLLLGFLIGTILQLVAPVLTQSIVDTGINLKNLDFIYLILIAQIMLFIGQTAVNFIQSWILLHISTRVNLAVLTDFFIKIMRLPMSFFEKKTSGDILQRLNDQQRIESFLTGTTVSTLFSFLNLFVFGFILIWYNFSIFLVFTASTVLYTTWILLFLRKRKVLDQKRFSLNAENQTYTFEMINSIQEIKLNTSESQKRWIWESLQARLFRLKVQSLSLSQYQQAGAMAINQLKNILIVFISAKAVIRGDITLGGMMAIQYIVGMISNPVGQLLGFIQSYQDAKISVERLNEIYNEQEEQPKNQNWLYDLPKDQNIIFKGVSFQYPGAGNTEVLKNVNLTFPQGKTTAIVGMSGSGKTTILKMLMRYYPLSKGEIQLGNANLDRIAFKTWRQSCGVVMQDGHIFADTIENNIAMGHEIIDYLKLEEAVRIANLDDFISEQPFGLQTVIGIAGKGISQGQRQRILIARAIYKNPPFVLLDEATNALDANNERAIVDKFKEFFVNRTVIIVAHRLSTVSYADNIIVLSDGEVKESGNHRELTLKKGYYYELVRNQLELGH